MKRIITIQEALEYELKSSWWAPHMGYAWMQNLAASYYAGKVRRKMKRYNQCLKDEEFLREYFRREITEK